MKKFSCHLLLLPAMLCALVLVFPAQSQDKPANNMEILRDKLKADKKLLVATNMELTESEAKNFWPVYDDYQKELQKINQRMVKLLNDYAADYRTNSVSDEKAKKLRRVRLRPTGRGESHNFVRSEIEQSAASKKSCTLFADREQDPRGHQI